MRSLLLLQGDLPTGSSQLGCALKSPGAVVKMHHKENCNCSATLHMAAYPPALSRHCKTGVSRGRLPERRRCSVHAGGGIRTGMGSSSTHSLCGFSLLRAQPQNHLFNAKERKYLGTE